MNTIIIIIVVETVIANLYYKMLQGINHITCSVIISTNRINFNLFLQVKFRNLKIENIVSSCDLKFPIRLEAMVIVHSQFVS